MLYEMIGGQDIILGGGRRIPARSGAFQADEREMPSHLLEWFTKIGAVRQVVPPVVAREPEIIEEERPLPRRRRPSATDEQEG